MSGSDTSRCAGRTRPVRRLHPVRPAGAVAAALIAAGLAGCSQVPDYHRPSFSALAPYSSGDTRDAPVSAVWWRSFSSTELNALEDRGLGGNFDAAAAIARIGEARGTAAIASAPLFPTIDLAGTLDRHTGPSSGSTQQAVFVAAYELDFWGGNRAASDSAKTLVDAASSDADTVAVTLTAGIANAYFQILSLRERIDQAERIAGDARRILSLVELQQAGGTASELQVEQQRNVAATFQANIPVLQQQLDQNMHLLAVLVGEQPRRLRIGARNLRAVRTPEPRGGLPSALLERRPDIRAAEARLMAANFDVGVAKAAFLPNVTIGGSLGLAAASLGSPGKLLTDAAAGLAQPVFNGGALQGQLDFDRAHVRELVAAYRQTALTAFQEVENALSAKRRLKALAAANLEAVTAARRAQALAEQQYKLGSSDYLTVLNTQRTLFQAEETYLQVRLAQLQAAVGLYRALGGGFAGSGGTGVVPPAAPGAAEGPAGKPI